MAKKILLADDSVTIQKVVELTLMDQDYEVVAVSDGDQALERFASSMPDLVIADVHMPGPDGYEVCRQAKAANPELPVILLVGSFEPFDTTKMASCGAELHLKKPFDSQELLRTVEEMLEGASSATPVAAAPEQEQPEEIRSFMQETPAAPEPTTAPPVPSLDLPPVAAVAPTPIPAPVVAPEPQPEPEPVSVPVPSPDASPDASPAISPTAVPLPAPLPAVAESMAEADPEPAVAGSGSALSDADVERIAQKVIDTIGERVIREVAWDVIPDLAEIVIRERLRELEGQVE